MIIFFFSFSFLSFFFLLSFPSSFFLLFFLFLHFFTLYHSLFFYPSLLLVLNFLFLFFSHSPSFPHPVSRIHYSLSLSFFSHLLSFNHNLFLSLIFHSPLPSHLLSLPLYLISFFHTRFFSSLYGSCDFARQRIDCRSIRVPFPPCCALPLYGHVYRKRRRILFTGTTVMLVLRTHVVEIKFPFLFFPC